MSMLTVVNRQSNSVVERTYNAFDLDGVRTIAVADEEVYALKYGPVAQLSYVVVSVDGLNPLTGEAAFGDAREPGYPVEAGGTLTVANWQEDVNGGGRFTFAVAGNQVATYVTAEGGLPVGYISVLVFRDSTSQHAVKPSYIGRVPHRITDWEVPLTFRDTRSSGDTAGGLGTGSGDYFESPAPSTWTPFAPVRVDYQQLRYLPIDEVRGRLPQHPHGFKVRQMANLGRVPRVGGASSEPHDMLTPTVSRFVTSH